ncbi:MAG: LpqM protein [Frankiales bacterium]|nr:LpqM protein [Frankiales bacterium]
MRLRLLALALLSTTLLTGCLDAVPSEGDSPLRQRAQEVVDRVRDAVEEAKQRQQEESGAVERRAPAGDDVLRTDTRTAFDYEEYSATVQQVLGSLDEYWSQALPEAFGVRYSSPSRYVYYRPEESAGPRCGSERAPAKNAFYCPAGDFIAWDESGLLIPYYVGSGDFAAAFVLAHEFGHAMQARLPEREPLGVLNELQADCFAGAWAAHVAGQGMLEAGDLDEATLAVFTARDVPGTKFTDPRAHGSGFERTRAFADGYESGPGRCYPAPRGDWVVQQTR